MAAILKTGDNEKFLKTKLNYTTITVYTNFHQNQSKFNFLAGMIISLCFQDFNDKNRIARPILKISGQMVDHFYTHYTIKRIYSFPASLSMFAKIK